MGPACARSKPRRDIWCARADDANRACWAHASLDTRSGTPTINKPPVLSSQRALRSTFFIPSLTEPEISASFQLLRDEDNHWTFPFLPPQLSFNLVLLTAMYLSYVFVSLLAALQVYGLGLAEQVGSSLSRRGPCDEYCTQADAVAPGCESASNRDQCICTAANYELMDACITCMVIEAKGRDAAVGLIDGTDGTSAELVEQTGEEVKDRMIKSCAAAGYPLDASGGTVTTMRGGPSGSVTTQGSSASFTPASSGMKGTASTTASSAAAVTSSAGNGGVRVSSVGGSVLFVVGVVSALL
ncbi:hypothetical protein FA13DRAFT_1725424 [Coprinellus micaceus]|uniref:Uncharacterized protein n=1 Tax=Coprinellus micaceus TaxID=71717 RepID=A0A4Y7TUB9_COPMI|nr:hypothetical protein FA13DRAFT_1725424 [Coprinellus micaceus]